MGRKRNNPPVSYLRVFNEGEKLTREQIDWLLSNRKGENNVKGIRGKEKMLSDRK